MRKLLGVLSAVGMATALLVPPVQAAVNATDATKLIQAVTGEVTEIVRTRTGVDREAAIRQLLQTNFDLPYMGRSALGANWAKATPDEQTRFLKAAIEAEAHAYSERFGQYGGQTLVIGRVTDRGNGVSVVDSKLNQTSGQPITIQWEVRDAGAGPRISDVKIEGVSIVMTRRSDFNSYIQNHGGKVEPLIVELENRSKQ